MSHDHAHDDHHVHVTPFWPMFIVLAILVFLTVFTVLTAHYIDLGDFNIHLAMLIATIKAILVFGFFMHLFYDKLINTVVVLSTLFAVALFIGISVMDLTNRHHTGTESPGEIVAGGPAGIVQAAIDKAEAEHHSAEHHDDAHGDDHADDEHSADSHAADDH